MDRAFKLGYYPWQEQKSHQKTRASLTTREEFLAIVSHDDAIWLETASIRHIDFYRNVKARFAPESRLTSCGVFRQTARYGDRNGLQVAV